MSDTLIASCMVVLRPLNHFLENLRDVLDLYDVGAIQDRPGILEIGDAIGAGSDELLGSQPNGLFHSNVGESFGHWRFKPDPASSHSTTETVLPRLSHLDQFQTRYLLQGLSRLVEYAVVPTQVTRVMVRDLLPILPGDLKSSLP